VEVQDWSGEPIEWMSETIGRQLIHTETMTLARVTLRQGAVVPVHEHHNEQISTVLEGRIDSVMLDVFCPVREDWIRGDDAYLRG
jgi:quercetin dioxygenase-like cupin family protein